MPRENLLRRVPIEGSYSVSGGRGDPETRKRAGRKLVAHHQRAIAGDGQARPDGLRKDELQVGAGGRTDSVGGFGSGAWHPTPNNWEAGVGDGI